MPPALLNCHHINRDRKKIMENPELFLNNLMTRLNRRLEALEKALAEGVQDVEKMHDYYWENYAEMDEYGYENFDNRQALLAQVNTNKNTHHLIRRLKKMLQNPYFGRVDFLYEGDSAPETFYIGIGNFSEKSGALPLVYDWRAPVSGLFYDYDKGPASYEAPGGKLCGEITSKWQYKIRGGKLIYAFESDTKIDDDILRMALGSRSDTALKNLVQTIQREQNAIIRNTRDRILVIQGVAGSGKTSVALHRIAYLLYHDRHQLKSSQVMILSPNGVFTDYISHILPELGEENICQMSLDIFAYRELTPWISDTEESFDDIEKKLRGEPGSEDRSYKLSPFLPGDLEAYALELEDTLMTFKPIKIRNQTMSVHDIMVLFHQKFTGIPLLKRMDAIFDYALDSYETLTGKTLPEEEASALREQTRRMYQTRDPYILYSRFLNMLGFQELPHLPKEKRFLAYEDVYPLLYLKYLLFGKGDHQKIRHLIIDEMQDYSYLQYRILAMLFNCPMTILGDKAQTLDDQERDVTAFLPEILGDDVRFISMNKSYRSTLEIGHYAAALKKGFTPRKTAGDNDAFPSGADKSSGTCAGEIYSESDLSTPDSQNSSGDIEFFSRHGDSVTILENMDFEEAVRDCLERYLQKKDDIETAAIITFSASEAEGAFRTAARLSRKRNVDPEGFLTLMDRNSSRFLPGLTVTTFYLAKGLEFDAVFSLENPVGKAPIFHQARYIAATRAMHSLTVYHLM